MFTAPSVVVVLGGGPSLSDLPSYITRQPFAVCCNDAYRLRDAPAYVAAMDNRWVCQHADLLLARGDQVYTQVTPSPRAGFYYFRQEKEAALSETWDRLAGADTGYAAINLAYLAGAKDIILAGFDMGFRGERTHWHRGHPIPSVEGNYKYRFRPAYAFLDAALRVRGVNLWQLPGSDVGQGVRRLSVGEAAQMAGTHP